VEPALGRPVSVRFVPDARVTGLAAIGCIAAAVLALTSAPMGRVLFGVAALILLAYVAGDLTFRPRLVADRSGLRIRSPFARRALSWSQVQAVRADERVRHGLRSVTLEIDSGDDVVVLTRRALGADPVEVARTLRALAS
jgi:hypothetical protein